jgi:spermidine synthase
MDNTRPAPAARARALLIGGGAADAERVAARIRPDAQVICFAPDRAAGDAIRQAFAARVPGARVAVMLGDPALLVSKVAGPFDLIVDAHPGSFARRERLRTLTTDGGDVLG